MEKFNEGTENDKKNDNNKEFVYLDIEYLNNRGRIVINLNNEIVPKTAANFSELCKKKAYSNSTFHRVISNFMIQGGDFTNFDGTGSYSIYGNKFPDENFTLKNKKGAIVMANSGPNTNGSQFYILTNDAPWLDGKHVVFGNVVKGMDLIEFIGNVETNNNDKPINDVKIIDCGIL
jgi:cyclophilin family peptidyl-prolyl cis-trans isomerase